MTFDLKINDFEGPLDLLLHLIKANKMDIFDIQIEVITEQYLDYLKQQKAMNLEVASEYLVLASELIELKSKLLLPCETIDNEVEEEDPRIELTHRLIEYEAYKKITGILKEKAFIRQEVYTRVPSNMAEYTDEDRKTFSLEANLDDLIDAFQKFLERKKEDKPLSTKVTENEVTVSSRRYDIKNILLKRKKVSFFELFSIVNKEYIVATFLAILEMAKSQELVIIQDKTFDDIVCEVKE